MFKHVKGVVSSTSGYSGGTAASSKYDLVSMGNTDHAEAVRVVYDPSQITFGQLLKVFFAVAHDPTELNRQGPGVVTAGDITCPADLEILNPELEIANLEATASLGMVLTIARGRGYVPADQNKGPGTTIGVIPVDSNFSPVRRVRYEVGAARVGQRTDYDKLTLEVETDGSVDPRTAVAQASAILIERLSIFADPNDIRMLVEEEPEAPQPGGEMANILIEELELGVRSYNCLKRVGVETIGDLISKSEDDLAAIPNFGKKSVEEVKENLARHGLALRDD